MKFIRFLLLSTIALSPLAFALEEGAPPSVAAVEVESPVTAQLVSENVSITPGEPFWVGVELKMAKGWDTYWQNPGDVGMPTQIAWQLPEGFEAGAIQWPYPEKIISDNMVAFGYTEDVLLLTQITAPKDFVGDKVQLKANVTWLACNDSCQPGSADVELILPVSHERAQKDSALQSYFNEVKADLPAPSTATVKTKKDQIIVHLEDESMRNFDSILFIPEKGNVIDHGAPQEVKMNRGGVEVSLKRYDGSDVLPEEFRGVMLFKEKDNEVIKALQIHSPFAAAQEGSSMAFWVALGLAFVGGMILNVMPCVMPVVALKIFSFVKMAQERRSLILQHGLIFTSGVLLSFWILSGVMLLLRFYGQSVGWGFQLQEPIFVAVLVGVLFLLALSLFGVFELGTSLISLGQKGNSSSSPKTSSFLSGVLATLVATPCTGPLLGPALGFALSLPAFQALCIFTGMGLGMAAPYLFFSAFPKFIRFLPKPGNWMITFKHVMGFLMLATVIWLIWVFGAQTSHMAIMLLLASLLMLGVGAWIYGTWGTPVHKKMTRWIAKVMALLALSLGMGTGVVAAKKFQDTPVQQIVQQPGEGWERYDPARVAALQAEGKPVFVDFTAKWCLICQANKVVLHSSEVTKLFEKESVITMTADWTKKDPTITKQLEKLGRSGVPVYVLYPPEKGAEPLILPQNLTANTLQDYLNRIHAS